MSHVIILEEGDVDVIGCALIVAHKYFREGATVAAPDDAAGCRLWVEAIERFVSQLDPEIRARIPLPG